MMIKMEKNMDLKNKYDSIIKQIINVKFQFHIIGKKITEVAFAQINRVMKIQMIIPEV